MDKKLKINIIGIAVTGLGMIIVPFLQNKYLVALDWILFICFVFSSLAHNLKQANLTLKDFNDSVENSLDESIENRKYAKVALYGLVRPMMLIGLFMVILNIIVFLIYTP